MGRSSLPRLARWGAVAAIGGALSVLPGAPAQADTTTIPGTLSTTATNTSQVNLAIPEGVRVRAITGVLTMPEIVPGGVVAFRVNGRTVETVDSSLYQKVRIPLRQSDVVADGTVAFTMISVGQVSPAGCRPAAGEATLRRIALVYRGKETRPTRLGNFFPPSAAAIDVVVPPTAGDALLEAGITAVGALASRYPDTDVQLTTAATSARNSAAHRRVVSLRAGRPGEVTTEISATRGVPTLTVTGVGEELTAAARALSAAGLGLAGQDSENLSQELKPRPTERTQSLTDLGASEITLSGYGTTTYRLVIPQDAFGTPVSALDLHLVGSHSAVSGTETARLDVRMNGALVGSTVLDAEPELDLEVAIPAGRLRAVNELELTLRALGPNGAACSAGGAPTIDLDIDTGDSTVTATRGTGKATGFQLYPQVFEGTLPVALRTRGDQRIDAAQDAAALVAALQRAAAALLEVQLIPANAFLADDRSGLIVGASSADSSTLDAPLVFSATRQVETADSTFEVTSQQTYAALESVKQPERAVLMLGSWAPGDQAAPPNLSHKVADAVTARGWDSLEGDLLIADADSPAFSAESGVEPAAPVVEEERSYVKWFVLVIALVLLVIVFQAVVSIRRARRGARGERDLERVDTEPGVDDLMEEPDQLAGMDDETAAAGGVRPDGQTAPGTRPRSASKPRESGVPTTEDESTGP